MSLMKKKLNSVSLIGKISSEIDIHYIDYNKAILKFSLEVEEDLEEANMPNILRSWHKIVAIGDMALACERLLKKLMFISLEGRLVYRKYTDKNAISHTITEIYLRDFEIIEQKWENPKAELEEEAGLSNEDFLFDFSKYELGEDEPPI